MNKEEAIKILNDYMGGKIDPESTELYQAIELAVDILESQPSLPSNLDEAANNYGIDIRLGYPRVMDETDKYIYNAFKAGAEWMAGQGASFNTKVGWIDGPTILDWPDDILDKFEMGDKVVVQIRKKIKK